MLRHGWLGVRYIIKRDLGLMGNELSFQGGIVMTYTINEERLTANEYIIFLK